MRRQRGLRRCCQQPTSWPIGIHLVSGQPLGHWEFYMALAYFKLAIIAAGIDYRRRMSEQAEGKDTAAESVPDVVAPLIARGLAEIAKKSG